VDFSSSSDLESENKIKECKCGEILIVDDNAFNIFTLKLILDLHLCGLTYDSVIPLSLNYYILGF
jgi:hypothetical protein